VRRECVLGIGKIGQLEGHVSSNSLNYRDINASTSKPRVRSPARLFEMLANERISTLETTA
jgi:hypothetical protein